MLILLTLIALLARIGSVNDYPPSYVIGKRSLAVTQSTIHSTVCVVGYTATVRDVTSRTKHAILRRDHAGADMPSEVDHYIPLELGGSNDPDNLWAQPYAGRYGARIKDVVERTLNRRVCSGVMTLKEAQACIISDWIACGRKIGVIK